MLISLENKLHRAKKLFEESKDRMKLFTGQKKSLQKELAELQRQLTVAQKEMKNLTVERDLLNKAREKTAVNAVFAMRNAPLLDFLDPTLKIEQIVLGHITDDRYFRHVPKVDRCITCHSFIAEKVMKKRSILTRPHPNLDLYLGEKSPPPHQSNWLYHLPRRRRSQGH